MIDYENVKILVDKYPDWTAKDIAIHEGCGESTLQHFFNEHPEIGYKKKKTAKPIVVTREMIEMVTYTIEEYPEYDVHDIADELRFPISTTNYIINNNPEIAAAYKANYDFYHGEEQGSDNNEVRKKYQPELTIENVVAIANTMKMHYGECVVYLESLTKEERRLILKENAIKS